MKPLLDLTDVNYTYQTAEGETPAVKNLSFRVFPDHFLGIIGPSGCGKSTLSKVILGFIRPDEGEIISQVDHPQMIFQDPFSSLNPAKKISWILEEPLRMQKVPKEERKKRVLAMAERVGLSAEHLKRRPHELSGGMRQRVMIAMALACSPKLIIADEPTTALDVTIQAQILDLLRNLKDQINSSIMFITHDLGVIAEMADYVVVMYAGRIVEQGTAEEIFAHPAHPYTIGLMASKPVVGRQVEKLYSIPGKVPNPVNMPNYCYFKDRCEMALPCCDGEYPCEISLSPTHKVSCYRYYENNRKAGE